MSCLIKQVDKFVKQNPSASLDVNMHWTSNGNYDKRICDTISLAFHEAAWIDHAHIENQLSHLSEQDLQPENLSNVAMDFSLFLNTLKLATRYVAHKKLRRAYAGMWSSRLPVAPEGYLPVVMQDTKSNLRQGFNLYLNFYPEMVRVLH